MHACKNTIDNKLIYDTLMTRIDRLLCSENLDVVDFFSGGRAILKGFSQRPSIQTCDVRFKNFLVWKSMLWDIHFGYQNWNSNVFPLTPPHAKTQRTAVGQGLNESKLSKHLSRVLLASKAPRNLSCSCKGSITRSMTAARKTIWRACRVPRGLVSLTMNDMYN